MAALPAGVTLSSSVRSTAGIVAYLGVLRGALDASIPIYVTSGERGPSAQASAMLTKLSEGGEAELFSVYRQNSAIIKRLLAAPRNAASWAAIIEEEAAGGRALSRHLRAGAIDLRTRDLTADQIKRMQIAVEATGGRHLLEGAPPHLHVDLPAKYALASFAQVTATTGAKVGLAVWIVGGLAFGVVLLIGARRRASAAKTPPFSATPTPNPRRRRRRRRLTR